MSMIWREETTNWLFSAAVEGFIKVVGRRSHKKLLLLGGLSLDLLAMNLHGLGYERTRNL